jgi:hypothetical protein
MIDVNDLKDTKAKLLERVKALDNLLKTYCELFEHTWVDDGHDSHYSYRKCSVCDRVEKE